MVAHGYALETALMGLHGKLPQNNTAQPIAKLLPVGESSIQAAQKLSKDGPLTFKWKIGISNYDTESKIFEELVKICPKGTKFRLDANEGFDLSQTEQWLSFVENKPVEFLEQPLPRGEEDSMNALKFKI